MSDLPRGEPRIAPLTPPYETETETILSKWMPPDSGIEPLLLFRTLAVHDELMSRMRPLGSGILGHGRIEARERELVIHRTCARTGAEYEWGVHVLIYGKPLGLTEEQIIATVHGQANDPVWTEDDALLIALADELHDSCTISDELWERLARRYHEDQLLELIIIAGWYHTISYVINAACVQHEPWAPRFPIT